MKFLRYISSYVLVPCMVMSTFLFTSCEEDGDGMNIENPDGKPVINYIRVPDADASDSLLVAAELGTTIVIMGSNLGGTREVWFNDQQASLDPTWVTNRNIFVSVPQLAPSQVTNKLYLVNVSGDTLAHDFKVNIPPPVVASAKNEWPLEGENLVINGDYFFEPISVTFPGGGEGEVVSVSQKQIEVTVPESATEGIVTVATNFGSAESNFRLWDSRNIILNFDDLVANGWRIGLIESTDGPVDGNYLVVRGDIEANQRDEGPGAPAESPLMMEYWGGIDDNRSGNFYPFYPNSYMDYVLKFEAKVNAWNGGYLNICFATPDHTNSNQEVWSNTINARAIWGPWAEAGEEFTTDDQWITVTIPLTDFHYYMGTEGDNVVYTPNQKFVEAAAGSISTWLLGSPENDGNFVEFYIDNMRIVEK